MVLFIPVRTSIVCQNQRPDFNASSMFQRCSSKKCTWTSLICSLHKFADDIVVDYSDRDPAVVCAVLTTAVTHLSSWLEDKGLLLNSAKNQVMFIRPRGAFDAAPSLVTCNNSVLQVTHVAKYLGVFIDDQLTWAPHTEFLAKKIGSDHWTALEAWPALVTESTSSVVFVYDTISSLLRL